MNTSRDSEGPTLPQESNLDEPARFSLHSRHFQLPSKFGRPSPAAASKNPGRTETQMKDVLKRSNERRRVSQSAPTDSKEKDGFLRPPADARGQPRKITNRPILSAVGNGEWIACASADHYAYLLHSTEQRTIEFRDGHVDWITSLLFLSDPSRVLTGAMDGRVALWTFNGSRKDVRSVHKSSITAIVNTCHPRVIRSAGYDKCLHWLRITSNDRIQPQNGMARVDDAVTIMEKTVLGTRRGSIFAIEDEKQVAHFLYNITGSCTGLSHSSGMTVAGNSKGKLVSLDHRLGKGSAAKELGGHRGPIEAIKMVEDFRVVSGGHDGRLILHDLRYEETPVWDVRSHRESISSVEVAGRSLFSGDYRGMVYVHDITDGSVAYALGANEIAVRSIIALPDSRLAVTGDDGCIMFYDYAHD